MAISTFGELKAAAAKWATYTDVDDLMPDFVTWATQEIGRRLRSSIVLKRADVAISGEFATAPTDLGAIRSFRLDMAPRFTLKVTSPEAIDELCANVSTQQYPMQVALEGPEFHFGPLFTGAVTGKLLYFARPAAFANDADTNVVLQQYPFLYLYGTLEALHRFKEDDDETDRFGALFGGLIESINATEAADLMRGPLQSSPGGVV